MILSLKTDNPVAEIGLWDGQKKISYHTWQADRQLAKDLLRVVHEQLAAQHVDWAAVTGMLVFEGPGSFTGLRIGITVANALAYGQHVPIVATQGEAWLEAGLARLAKGDNDRLVLPHYGAEARVTAPKK